jgi:hypothetical protein
MVPDAVNSSESGPGAQGVRERSPKGPQPPQLQRGGSGRYSLDHRALLFSSRLGPSREVNRKGQEAAEMSRVRQQEMLEEQNGELLEALEVKTSALKRVALEIGKEASHSNTLLERMSSTFEGAQDLLNKSQEPLLRVTTQARSSHLGSLVGVILVLMLIFYFLSGQKGGSARAFLK